MDISTDRSMASKDPRYGSLIPTLDLSPRDEKLLVGQALDLVHEAVEDAKRLQRNNHGERAVWKEVRRWGTIQVFRERHPVGALPQVLAVGHIAGTLGDIVYGAMAATPGDVLVNARCMGEPTQDAKVLCVLHEPSTDQPFQYIDVKWLSFLVGNGLGSPRDCTVVDAVGFVRLPSGEHLSYVLRHSVDFDALPSLSKWGVVRANVAICALYRQVAAGTLQCFVRSFYDLGSNIWKPIGVKFATDRALAMCKFVECAEMKKLARLWSLVGRCSDWGDYTRPSFALICSVCHNRKAKPALLITASKKKQRNGCAMCRRDACARCLHKKTIHSMAADERVTTRKLRVCTSCLQEALRTSISDALAYDRQEQRSSSSTDGVVLPPSSSSSFILTDSMASHHARSEE